MSKQSLINAVLALALAFAGVAQAGTLTVTNTSDGPVPGPVGSLRRAISDAASGDTINFSLPANSTVNLTTAELLINKDLTISGPGANLLSVQRSPAAGTPAFRIFSIRGELNVTLSSLTIANGSSDNGGGILSATSTVTITNSTLSGNRATGDGGGIYNIGTLTITSSTISGNTASFGGGIYNEGLFGTVNVTNSTISANSAGRDGGGIANFLGNTLTARNTIVAGNTATNIYPDVNGSLSSQGFNLIGNNAGAAITPAQFSDQIGTAGSPIDPLLGPLQGNGGPTRTHALLSGSRAIDNGHSSGSFTDQRGFSRPVDQSNIPNASGGDGGDIGAFEFGGAAASLKILSITRSGNGPVVLQVAGVPNGVHRIQASVDLSFGSFIDIAAVTADAAGLFQYQHTPAGLTRNFYRVAFP